ncbi:hypothetical protein BASA50_003361 [Batrachochytrium salamandrivorans]|uniref:Uncharacterized protein n=1 Tax=Batrachochytrium salamandrivorans TaxID=1357716 RepID=A0ABQ8FIH8_9FUNG|nr:hypothetical protein BASA50_003361 [Batrachochytrium salamandrivorans]
MRLISFAAVSLLAITVSAQPPHNTDTDAMDQTQNDAIQEMDQTQNDAIQEIEKFQGISDHDVQDAATQSAQQNQGATSPDIQQLPDDAAPSAEKLDRNKAQIEMDRLTEAYETQDRRCSQIYSHITTDKRRDKEVRDIINKITIKLQETGLSSSEILRLRQKGYDFGIVLDQLITRHKENHRSYEDATEKRSIIHAELQLLKDSQKLMTKHNSKNEVKVELSPDSCYNMDMLKKQYNKVLKDIDNSLVEQKTIDNLLLSSDDDALKTQSAQLADRIRILENYNGAAREILWQARAWSVDR